MLRCNELLVNPYLLLELLVVYLLFWNVEDEIVKVLADYTLNSFLTHLDVLYTHLLMNFLELFLQVYYELLHPL